MESNRPYLWLSKNGTTYTLNIKVDGNSGVFSLADHPYDLDSNNERLTITFKQDAATGGTITPYNIILNDISHFDSGIYKKITVKLVNGTTILGLCTMLTELAAASDDEYQPYIWLKFINTSSCRLYIDNAFRFNPAVAPNPTGNKLIVTGVNGTTGTNYINLDSSNQFDPSTIDYIQVSVINGANNGETSTGSSEGDASGGGNELLRSFY